MFSFILNRGFICLVSILSFILIKVSYIGIICCYLRIHLYWTRGHMLVSMFSFILNKGSCRYLCSHLYWARGHKLVSMFSFILNKGSYVCIYVLIYIEQISYVSMFSFILNKVSYVDIYVIHLYWTRGQCWVLI